VRPTLADRQRLMRRADKDQRFRSQAFGKICMDFHQGFTRHAVWTPDLSYY
jgi:hypothetical protein